MSMTLLEIVQSILSDMDSENVNSIDDSVESQQVSKVVRDTFLNMVSTRTIPEHKGLFSLAGLSDPTRPTHFTMPDNIQEIELVRYNVATSGTQYRTLKYIDPVDFLLKNSTDTSDTVVVNPVGETDAAFIVRSDKMPEFYTTFNDEYLVMDSYDSSVESTLQQSKIQVFGEKIPTFTLSDSFTPDIDDVLFPYLLAESKSTCFSLFKGGVDQKIEQAARRQKTYSQNDVYKLKTQNKRPMYGRH